MSSTSASRQLERRRERRIAIGLPMELHGTDRDGKPFEETARSENVCAGGLAFATRLELALGMEVEIRILLPPRGSEPASDFVTRGRIVHVKPLGGRNEKSVGVQFIGPRFPRIFRSEALA